MKTAVLTKDYFESKIIKPLKNPPPYGYDGMRFKMGYSSPNGDTYLINGNGILIVNFYSINLVKVYIDEIKYNLTLWQTFKLVWMATKYHDKHQKELTICRCTIAQKLTGDGCHICNKKNEP